TLPARLGLSSFNRTGLRLPSPVLPFLPVCHNALMVRTLIVCALLLPALSAQTTITRLVTLLPGVSHYHVIIPTMSHERMKESGGTIELKIYAGGEQGDEPEMVQKMHIKKLQAVAISGAGLADLDPSVYALQIPMLLDSYEELDYVRDHISPRLEKELAQRG